MQFTPPLTKAKLIKRYKRFLADIELLEGENAGEIVTIHCPNTGSMMNTFAPDTPIWYLPSTDKSRKTAGTWVIATTPHNRLAMVNTHYANNLVEEALKVGIIEEVGEYKTLKREVKYGEENSRIDFYLEREDGSPIYIEVKSVTLGFEDSTTAAFPDAVTARGAKHLRELMKLAESGVETFLFYCVNLSGIDSVRPAEEIDPKYAQTLKEAKAAGVKVIAYGSEISPEAITLSRKIKVLDL